MKRFFPGMPDLRIAAEPSARLRKVASARRNPRPPIASGPVLRTCSAAIQAERNGATSIAAFTGTVSTLKDTLSIHLLVPDAELDLTNPDSLPLESGRPLVREAVDARLRISNRSTAKCGSVHIPNGTEQGPLTPRERPLPGAYRRDMKRCAVVPGVDRNPAACSSQFRWIVLGEP